MLKWLFKAFTMQATSYMCVCVCVLVCMRVFAASTDQHTHADWHTHGDKRKALIEILTHRAPHKNSLFLLLCHSLSPPHSSFLSPFPSVTLSYLHTLLRH